MEIILALVVAVIVGFVVYSLTRSSEDALEVLDVNKDGKVNADDAKEVVKKTTRAVKKVATQATAPKRGRKPAATKTPAKKKGA